MGEGWEHCICDFILHKLELYLAVLCEACQNVRVRQFTDYVVEKLIAKLAMRHERDQLWTQRIFPLVLARRWWSVSRLFFLYLLNQHPHVRQVLAMKLGPLPFADRILFFNEANKMFE